MNLFFSQLLSIFHDAVGILLVPTLVLLTLMFILCLIEFIAFLIEGYRRDKITKRLMTQIQDFSHSQDILQQMAENSLRSKHLKQLVHTIITKSSTISEERIRQEELLMQKMLERSDIATKLGPFLGLMGTLIPLGPGLSALANGDVNTLANSMSIAFDTTVLGLSIGGMGFVISRVRRRWYEEYIFFLEVVHSKGKVLKAE